MSRAPSVNTAPSDSVSLGTGPATYDAFISYSRRNIEFARRLHKALERYTPPGDMPVAQRNPRVFRDEADFVGVDYQQAVGAHLAASGKLIVLCSPEARASGYVDDEIRRFINMHGAQHVVPVLVAGLPNNEVKVGQEAEMAFPKALCEALAMPLAADYRGFNLRRDKLERDAFEGPWYTLLANLYGVGRNQIEQRDRRRLRRRRNILAGLTGTVMLALATLAAVALWQKAQAQKQEARATARQLAAQAQLLMQDERAYPRLPALLALQSLRIDPTPEALDVVDTALERLPPDRLRVFHDQADPGMRYQPIAQLDWTPSGRHLVSVDPTGDVKIWDTEASTDAPRRFQAHHWHPRLLFDTKSNYVAVLAGNGADTTFVDVARISDGTVVATTSSSEGPLDIAAWHRSAFIVGGVRRDGQVVVQDLLARRALPLPPLPGRAGAVDWASAAGLLAIGVGHRLVFWNPDSASVIRTVPLAAGVDKLAVAPHADGYALRLRDKRLWIGGADNARPLHAIPTIGDTTPLAFTPGGRYLLTAESDGQASLRAADGHKLFALRTAGKDFGLTAAGNMSDRESVMALDLSRNDAVLVDARRDGTVNQWEFGMSPLLGSWGVMPGMNRVGLMRHGLDLVGVRVTPDGQGVLTVGSGSWMRDDGTMQPGRSSVRIWQSEHEVARISPGTPIAQMALSPDATKVAVASAAGELSVYCVCSNASQTTQVPLSEPATTAVAHGLSVIEAGNGLLATAVPGQGVLLWHGADDRQGQLIDTEIPGLAPPLDPFLRFSSDGSVLAWWSMAGELRLYETKTRRRLLTRSFPDKQIASVALAPAVGRVAVSLWGTSASSVDAAIQILDLASGQTAQTLPTGPARVLSISADGLQVLLHRPSRGDSLAGSVEVWRPQDGPSSRTLPGDDRYVSTASFSADGRRLLLLVANIRTQTAGPLPEGQTLEIWDMKTMQLLRKQPLKTATRTNIAVSASFDPNGERVSVLYRRIPSWAALTDSVSAAPYRLQTIEWDAQQRAAQLLSRLEPEERQLTLSEWQQYLPDRQADGR